jgi:hypothetical protein
MQLIAILYHARRKSKPGNKPVFSGGLASTLSKARVPVGESFEGCFEEIMEAAENGAGGANERCVEFA